MLNTKVINKIKKKYFQFSCLLIVFLASCSEKEWIFDCRGFCEPALVVNFSPPIYEDFILNIKTQNDENIELACPETKDVPNKNLYSCLEAPGPLDKSNRGFKSIVYSLKAEKIWIEIKTAKKNYTPKYFLLNYEGIDKRKCSQDSSVEPCQTATVEMNITIEDTDE